jgi:hypothetical protein
MGSERILKHSPKATDYSVYRAPKLFVAAFYLLLVAWTLVCASLIGLKASQWGWANLSTLLMIVFILVYTWYFSVAISYQISVSDDGFIRLKSIRRTIEADANKIGLVEGPRLPIGFLRLRLEREKAYIFCVVSNEAFKRVVSVIRAANPDAKFKGRLHSS